MLEFAEKTFIELRRLERETQAIIIGGNVKSMEQYKHLMGRLEGYKFVEEAIQNLLSKNPDL